MPDAEVLAGDTVTGAAVPFAAPPFLVVSTPSMKALSASLDIIAMFNSPFLYSFVGLI